VVAASRTEERSSFYHVSRWAAGRGHGSPPPRRGEPCTESRRRSGPGGRLVRWFGEGPENHPCTRRDNRSPLALARASERASERAPQRLSSDKVTPAGRGGTFSRGPARVALHAFEFHAKFGQFQRACTSWPRGRDQPRFNVARCLRCFFCCTFLPLSLSLSLSRAFGHSPLSLARGRDGVLDRSSGPAILEEDRR